MLLKMVESLTFMRAGASEKIPGAVQERTASATLLKFSFFVQLGYQKQL